MRVGILGANGRMGRVLIEALESADDATLGAALVRADSSLLGMDVGELAGVGQKGVAVSGLSDDTAGKVDVMIDFTLPAALSANLAWCRRHNKPIVIGTTGLNEAQLTLIDQAAEEIPVVFAANYSVGVNLLLSLVRQAASVLAPKADIEISETHHRYKQDAPSGTALALGEAIADELGWSLPEQGVYARHGHTGERPANTIGFATLRAGDVVGEHTVLFADLGERLELTHKASSRATFANGAVRAAQWLAERPAGLYSMQNVLNLRS